VSSSCFPLDGIRKGQTSSLSIRDATALHMHFAMHVPQQVSYFPIGKSMLHKLSNNNSTQKSFVASHSHAKPLRLVMAMHRTGLLQSVGLSSMS
jgi:hypothetical protein